MRTNASRGACAAALALAACAAGPADLESAAAPVSKPGTFMSDVDIGPAVRAALGGDWEAHYFDAEVDLNDDGAGDLVAYVAGPMVCGTAGCPVFVFSRGADGYELVGRISVAYPPVRLSPRSTAGWRNLIVRVAGGGIAENFDAELAWDGTAYSGNASIAPAKRVTDLSDAKTLIPMFESFRDGKPVPPPEA